MQYATAEIGVILVNVNPAYRTHELAYALNQSGCRWVIASPPSRPPTIGRWSPKWHPTAAALERSVFFWDDDWDDLAAGRIQEPTCSDDDLEARGRHLDTNDPINIQYTSGTTGFPKGATLTHRGILNNGRTSCRPGIHPRGPALHSRALLPLLRHGDGQPRVHVDRRHDGHSRRLVRPGGRADRGRTGTLHRAVRRADDVSRRARSPELRRVRPHQPAHRGDGRIAVPRRHDEGVRRADAHDRGDDLLRNDRDVAGVDPDADRRHVAAPDRDRRHAPTPTSRSASPTRSPATRSRGASPASSAPAATR